VFVLPYPINVDVFFQTEFLFSIRLNMKKNFENTMYIFIVLRFHMYTYPEGKYRQLYFLACNDGYMETPPLNCIIYRNQMSLKIQNHKKNYSVNECHKL